MPKNLISTISNPILDHFRSKSDIFTLFRELDTGPEEWFRVEILDVIKNMESIKVLATNQRHKDISGRPDFVLLHDEIEKVVELKVLPTDRNYTSGYQRFCAGKTNRADFDALSNGEVSAIIYIHWPDTSDFEATRKNLEKRYAVSCHSNDIVVSGTSETTVSFWLRKKA